MMVFLLSLPTLCARKRELMKHFCFEEKLVAVDVCVFQTQSLFAKLAQGRNENPKLASELPGGFVYQVACVALGDREALRGRWFLNGNSKTNS